MDINLPGASGVEATRRASQIAPATAVLVISMVDDDDSVFAALAAGARGYVLKGASAAEITAALRPSPLLMQDDLTTREREVLDLLAEGASNRQIARSLGVSLKTVQNHVSRILDKLQAADRTQAALRARGVPPASRLASRPEPGLILPSVPSPGMLAHVIDPDSAVPPYDSCFRVMRRGCRRSRRSRGFVRVGSDPAVWREIVR